jgi:hypothetical protein
MMKNSEFYDQLAWEQYISLAGNKAIYQALNKVLMFDLIRQARRNAVLCSNDVKRCYDRIIYAVVTIVMQQQNVMGAACVCVFTTLQNLHYAIRTIWKAVFT